MYMRETENCFPLAANECLLCMYTLLILAYLCVYNWALQRYTWLSFVVSSLLTALNKAKIISTPLLLSCESHPFGANVPHHVSVRVSCSARMTTLFSELTKLFIYYLASPTKVHCNG